MECQSPPGYLQELCLWSEVILAVLLGRLGRAQLDSASTFTYLPPEVGPVY